MGRPDTIVASKASQNFIVITYFGDMVYYIGN